MCRRNEVESHRFMLLDTSLIDRIYYFLNETEIFFIDDRFKAKHSCVCAAMDRLREESSWINQHLAVPKGSKAPNRLKSFMMHACIVRSSVISLLNEFGLYAASRDSNNEDSRRFFSSVLKSAPLNIQDISRLTDDSFFQYFRSLVFAHPTGVSDAKGILLNKETQYCPYIIEQYLQECAKDPDDYVGVRIYSNISERDDKTLKVRFSAIKEFLKSRYNDLNLLIKHLDENLKKKERAWRSVVVDTSMSEVEQLRFILSELRKRNAQWPEYYTVELLSYLEAPCSCEENRNRVNEYRAILLKHVPFLVQAFMRLDYSSYCDTIDKLIEHEVPDELHVDYSLQKIFEYLNDPDRYHWVTHDLNIVMKSFAAKWVRIDFQRMPKEEIALLVTIACFNERIEHETR